MEALFSNLRYIEYMIAVSFFLNPYRQVLTTIEAQLKTAQLTNRFQIKTYAPDMLVETCQVRPTQAPEILS
jgi:hypothetical protein